MTRDLNHPFILGRLHYGFCDSNPSDPFPKRRDSVPGGTDFDMLRDHTTSTTRIVYIYRQKVKAKKVTFTGPGNFFGAL